MACPSGWTLPGDEDFLALAKWLTANGKWDEWNSGFAGEVWWGSSERNSDGTIRRSPWRVKNGKTSGDFPFLGDLYDYSYVRCIKKPGVEVETKQQSGNSVTRPQSGNTQRSVARPQSVTKRRN
jgi:hypothetical protein